MANDNPANNLSDEARSKGGQNTPSQFGKPKGADPHKAGSMGADAQPIEAKQEGGRKSGSNSNRS